LTASPLAELCDGWYTAVLTGDLDEDERIENEFFLSLGGGQGDYVVQAQKH
jgi:hypothetical protein